VAAVMTFSCVRNIAVGHVKEDFGILRNVDRKEWIRVALTCPLLGCVTIGTYYLLCYVNEHSLIGKILNFSWLQLLASPKDNVTGTNLIVSGGASIPFFGVFFCALLLVNMPGLALSEEESFRRGTKSWLDAVPRSIAFGMMHCLVGVPVSVGIALTLAGLWFTFEYFKGGVERSGRVHACYNMMLVVMLMGFLIWMTLPHAAAQPAPHH
jgi:hypothetical protein